ncbi:E3 ubiquitin-protein ligase rnf146-like [Mizuhopecten yessoensis]|uniref:E3 ubiquitin-protein ligase rnf146-like n=1 Tax=Mizuhopecten yessoensis TaxID=6573 RepID=UPI000B45E8AD|nr:E3 ubiquitin-protein ligase rnf146-like [Mizuhopecten yessoensis]
MFVMDRNEPVLDIRNRTSRSSTPNGDQEGQQTATKMSNEKDTVEKQAVHSKLLDKDQKENGHDIIIECSVCLQPCIHPVQLPCQHIFCFLCVKGAAHRSKRCALCRQEIIPEFFQKPKLIRQQDLEKTIAFDDKYQWFYEGRNGWWQYDDRTSQELEIKHKNGDKLFELLIAGFLYVIDLENMVQFRRNDRTRKRNIKRDETTMEGVKGVAGLKYSNQSSTERPGAEGVEQPRASSGILNVGTPTDIGQDDAILSPPAPNNTPQTPQTPADSPPDSTSGSQQDLSRHFEHLSLDELDQPQTFVQQTDTGPDQSHQRSQMMSSSGQSVSMIHLGQHPVSGQRFPSISGPIEYELGESLYSSSDSSDND